VQERLLQAMQALFASGQRGALATVVRTSGSTPQQPGARMLLCADGSLLGTVGGGAIESAVRTRLEAVLADGTSELFVRELGHDLGMCCGGRMEFFLEPVGAVPRLWLCGAGHIAQALARVVPSLGFELVVCDAREELNDEARFPSARRELLDGDELLKQTALGARDWLLITTHDHALDERILERALSQAPRYIGLVGSRRKVVRLLERIAQRCGPLALERVYAPVGLVLGAVGPEEIAISIAAELVALRRGAEVPHMRALDDPRLRKLLERG